MRMKTTFPPCFILRSLQKNMKSRCRNSVKVCFNLCDHTYFHKGILAVYEIFINEISSCNLIQR